MFPASVNGVYAMTLTHNAVPSDGVFKLGDPFDRVGIMAADPLDLRDLCAILLSNDRLQYTTLSDDTSQVCKRMSIGILPSSWGIPDDDVDRKWGLPEVVTKLLRI